MTDRYDITIIGGGIHGVGVAQAAAAAGYSVLVLEKSGLAAGTSSCSSKLIHGGLRYLEGGHLRLVRECLRERRLLVQLAPDLVQLQRFFIPVYRSTRRRPLTIRMGLTLYALLGGLRRSSRFRRVRRREWNDLDGLTTTDLRAVYQYWDAQTDDRRLTEAVMHSAAQHGAALMSPALFTGATIRHEDVELTYELAGVVHRCTTRVVVNAGGPWVNEIAERVTPRPPMIPVSLVQGAHIVLDAPLTRGIYYMEAPSDGRAVFAMPWKGHTLVGTTETEFHGSPDHARALEGERRYLLDVVRHYFPQRDLSESSITESFAGLRVLPASGGAAFSRSRETTLLTDRAPRPRYLGIYGGKLTAYRATAEKILSTIRSALPNRPAAPGTDELPLTHPQGPVDALAVEPAESGSLTVAETGVDNPASG